MVGGTTAAVVGVGDIEPSSGTALGVFGATEVSQGVAFHVVVVAALCLLGVKIAAGHELTMPLAIGRLVDTGLVAHIALRHSVVGGLGAALWLVLVAFVLDDLQSACIVVLTELAELGVLGV